MPTIVRPGQRAGFRQLSGAVEMAGVSPEFHTTLGEPCAGEPHARFDGRDWKRSKELDHGRWGGTADRETGGTNASGLLS